MLRAALKVWVLLTASCAHVSLIPRINTRHTVILPSTNGGLLVLLQAWQMAAMRRQAKGLKCVAALSHWQGHTLRKRFAIWRSAAVEAAAKQGTADAHYCSTCRRRTLAAWRQQARRQAVLARCGEALAQKSAATLLRAHMRAWLAATGARQHRRDVLARCLARLANRQLADSFVWWRELMLKQRVARRCAACLTQRHAAAALQQWRSWAGEQQAKRERLAACVRCMQHWRMAGAWHLWRSRVTAWAEKRQMVERCVALLRCGVEACLLVGGLGEEHVGLHPVKPSNQVALNPSVPHPLQPWRPGTLLAQLARGGDAAAPEVGPPASCFAAVAHRQPVCSLCPMAASSQQGWAAAQQGCSSGSPHATLAAGCCPGGMAGGL